MTSPSPGAGPAVTAAVTVGIDLGGTGTRLVALDHAGVLRSRVTVPTRRDHHGTPYRGSDGVHPEAGHIPVPGPPAPCYCGLATCWEQLASRTALDTATGHAADEVAAAATAGDQRSRQILDRYADNVGTGLATLTTVFRPARIVVGGSAARYLPLLRPGIDRALTRSRPYAWKPPVAAAELGDYSGAIGAAVLPRVSKGHPGMAQGLALESWRTQPASWRSG